MKKRYIFLFIILISSFTTYKAFLAYTVFINNNIPVYDGVMYEAKQIKSYMRYKENFSLKERLNRVYYEFEGNMQNSGFNCMIALLNPKWFVNDTDIILRAFLSVCFFSIVLFNYLKYRTSEINSILIITLLFQLPLFYNYGYGLTTYVPEIPSALFLLGGYILILTFLKSEKVILFCAGCILMITSIMFRFNFFVYSICFIIPFLYLCFKILFKKPKQTKFYIFGFLLTCIAFVSLYVFGHLSLFLNYYNNTALPGEGNVTLYSSIISLFEKLKEQIGLIGLISLLSILLLSNQYSYLEKAKQETFFLIYPFIFHFSFIILYLFATNVSHVIAAMVIFSFSAFLFPNKLINKIYSKFKVVYIRIFAIVLIISLNINYVYSYNSYNNTAPEYIAPRKVAEYIIQEKNLSSNYKYICFFDEMVEIQIDVAVYKKTGVWLNSTNHFYLNDVFLKNISPELSDSACIKYYTNKIKDAEYDLIAINKSVNKVIKPYEKATKINEGIKLYLIYDQNYFPDKIISTTYHGDIIFYKKKSALPIIH